MEFTFAIEPKKNKSCDIDYADDYNYLKDLNNPYDYNFGKVLKAFNGYNKIQNKVNPDYLGKNV